MIEFLFLWLNPTIFSFFLLLSVFDIIYGKIPLPLVFTGLVVAIAYQNMFITFVVLVSYAFTRKFAKNPFKLSLVDLVCLIMFPLGIFGLMVFHKEKSIKAVPLIFFSHILLSFTTHPYASNLIRSLLYSVSAFLGTLYYNTK